MVVPWSTSKASPTTRITARQPFHEIPSYSFPKSESKKNKTLEHTNQLRESQNIFIYLTNRTIEWFLKSKSKQSKRIQQKFPAFSTPKTSRTTRITALQIQTNLFPDWEQKFENSLVNKGHRFVNYCDYENHCMTITIIAM